MKNKPLFLLLSIFIGALLFSYLFWMERLALNLLIYSTFLVSISYFNTETTRSPKFHLHALAHLLGAVLVVINQSALSLAAYYISLILFVGYSHYPAIRTIWVAFMATAVQLITVPANLIWELSSVKIGSFQARPIFRPIKYIILPMIILIVFACIYSAANEVFAHYLELILDRISNLFNEIFGFIFQDLSLPRIMHFCFGFLVTAGLLLRFKNRGLEQLEGRCQERLIRRKGKSKSVWYEIVHTFSGDMLTRKTALKTEYTIGILSFTGLNALLFILNTIDISTLWFGYTPSGHFSADVHEGTNSLIFSILMAMAVILYFFRGNLNFYSKSKTLKALAFAWMVQNFVLIISVFIRDGYYIEFYGLTHKRIGVLVFALLCIIGLSTVYLKVAKQKTLFYLFKINGNIWFFLLMAFSVINWDVLIAKYNLSHSDSITLDAGYLLSLSDKTLPLLHQNRQKLKATVNSTSGLKGVDLNTMNVHPQETLDIRIGYFKERYQKVSWVSWNVQDWNTADYFGFNK